MHEFYLVAGLHLTSNKILGEHPWRKPDLMKASPKENTTIWIGGDLTFLTLAGNQTTYKDTASLVL